MKMHSYDKKYFIIASHGWSASNWLAYSLNLHPQIICSHSARNILANHKDGQSNQNLRQSLQSLHQGYLNRQTVPIDESYDVIEKFGNAKVYGSVHLYRLRDLPVLYEKHGSFKRFFKVINLIRHPVTLIWSGYGQFQDLFRYDINELYWTLGKVLHESRDFVFDLARRYNLYIGDFENLAFIGAACVLGSLKNDFDSLEKVKNIPSIDFHGFIKMEDITNSRELFIDMLKVITDATVLFDQRYLEEVKHLEKINCHKKDGKQLTPCKRYQFLKDWQKETLKYYLHKYNLISKYENLGYEMEFIQ